MAQPLPRYGVSVAVGRDEIDTTGDLVSVITRTRNRKSSLREAIRSVAEQTWKSVQLVVVNDGGEDVEDVVAPFRERIDITLLQPGRVRRCRAANLALGAARGTWIAWLDDDDGYLPHHLEVLVRELKRGPEKFVYTDARRQDLARQPDGSYRVVHESVPYQEEFSRLKLVQQAFIHLVTVGHHRSLFEELGGFDETIEVLEDHDMFIRFAQYHDFRRVPEVTSVFRVRDDGTNAITALKQEFVETRALLFQRYGHMAFFEIFSQLELGRKEITVLHERLRRLEAGAAIADAPTESAP